MGVVGARVRYRDAQRCTERQRKAERDEETHKLSSHARTYLSVSSVHVGRPCEGLDTCWWLGWAGLTLVLKLVVHGGVSVCMWATSCLCMSYSDAVKGKFWMRTAYACI